MKRWILYAVALAMLGLSPFRGMDIGKLSPVQTVWLTEDKGQICMQTDTGDFGIGADVKEALHNLNKSAAGIVFLETADYLVIEAGREVLLEQAIAVFRPSCRVCAAEQLSDLNQATDFLRTHEPIITLRQWTIEQNKLQQLQEKDGRFSYREG